MNSTCIVIDFETTGLSAGRDRAIEVAAVIVSQNKVVDRFQSLMNPGIKIDSFIENYTGITNRMIKDAPSNSTVMRDLHKFMGNIPLVAHNASFDKRFLEFEYNEAGKELSQQMACSLLVARRLYQEAPNHKLKTLVDINHIHVVGNFHRALADAEMTAGLWIKMKTDLMSKYGLEDSSFDFMYAFGKTPKKKLGDFTAKYRKK